jgi:signal transduction histidine kinase
MRSLFLKIFLGFWLVITLTGAVGIILVLTTDPMAADLARIENRITPYGREMVQVLENEGPQALSEFTLGLQRTSRLDYYLFNGRTGPLSGRDAPARVKELAGMAASSGQKQILPGKEGLGVAFPLENGYIIAANLPPRSIMAKLFHPRHLGLRLGVTFLISGIVCYLLARSLTAPIRKLRLATQEFAAGNLATRVGPVLASKGGEIGDLAVDFDRMAERIEELVDTRHRLLRDISHELRSPLARLNVALEIARRKSGPSAGDALDRIGKEAERLNGLIGQILTLTLLEEGAEGMITRAPVDLDVLTDEVTVDADFEARNHSRSVRLVSKDAVTIKGSEEMLRRAIENVVRNAVHHTAEGTEIEVALERRQGVDGERARITVRDHGPGVPEEALTRLFLPLYRVAEARDRQTGGAGVGLAITKRAIALHGGTVTASNAPGGGLLVEITLPVEEGHGLDAEEPGSTLGSA